MAQKLFMQWFNKLFEVCLASGTPLPDDRYVSTSFGEVAPDCHR